MVKAEYGRPADTDALGYARKSLDPLVGAVHDVGNLIQVASSALNIVARSPQIRGSNLDDVIAGAKASLERAGMMVRQTIAVGRERAANVCEVNVTDCLADIEAIVETTWGQKVGLEFQVSSDLLIVRCDPLALQSAVLNLLLNARDATRNGGKIHVRAEEVALQSGMPGIEIGVVDGGIGMTPETAARAMEPFFTTKLDGLGGAGLPMAEKFANEAGGKILIESEYGVGTIVRLQLPASVLPMDGYLTS